MRVLEFKPPGQINYDKRKGDFKIFLAGSIEMGTAENWQDGVKYTLSRIGGLDFPTRVVLFNPRRDKWNPDLPQEFENPQFYQQVSWELNALEQADLIIMNILPDTKSPITLLELGLYTNSEKLWVCCPKGFWRKGNVDVVCDRYGVPLFSDFGEMMLTLTDHLS